MKFIPNALKRKVQRIIIYISLSILMLVSIMLCFCSGEKKQKGIDDPAVMVVNGQSISQKQIDEITMAFRMQQSILNQERFFFEGDGDLKRGAARQLASSILMLDVIRSKKWEVPKPIVDSIADNIAARFGGHDAFISRLNEMGESEEAMRKDIAEGILLDSLVNSLGANAGVIPENECRVYYEENKKRYFASGKARASHIVFTYDPTSGSPDQINNIMEKANEALTKAKGGEDFNKLIKIYSSMPDNGDMGWFKTGDLTPDLENALFSLKKGEISELTPSAMGIHILKKTDEEEPRQMLYNEVSDMIKKSLELQKKENAVNDYIDSLLTTAKIRFIDTSLTFTSTTAKVFSAP